MNNVDGLIRRARDDRAITGLHAEARRGAEAFFECYALLAAGNEGKPSKQLRNMAWRYLDITAIPPLDRNERRGANVARNVLRRLS